MLLGKKLAAIFATAFVSTIGPVAHAQTAPRVVVADIVALDQLLVYNRFGSFNPFGMVFALKRDVSAAESDPDKQRITADDCAKLDGTEAGTGALKPGQVMLKPCKRPRPLVLRGNVGDILEVRVQNLLQNVQADAQPPANSQVNQALDISGQPSNIGCGANNTDAYPPKHFCREGVHNGKANAPVSATRCDIRKAFDPDAQQADINSQCRSIRENEKLEAADAKAQGGPAPDHGDWPKTRLVSFAIPGLEPVAINDKIEDACKGLGAVAPGQSFTCRWRLEREGTHVFSSLSAPSGGEGDAGSLGHGLFGALIVEAQDSIFYRSQVTQAAVDAAWPRLQSPPVDHARGPKFDYAAASSKPAAQDTRGQVCDGAVPILNMLRTCATSANAGERTFEIVHSDLNAIIVPAGKRISIDKELEITTDEDHRTHLLLQREKSLPFREFTVIFHDELKTFYVDKFKELEQFGQLSGIRDGFAINYGASGAGSIVLANRKKVGPAANCPECMYEEFFLESWANGDPALLEQYPDDPSNVHHSYLNDKVVFRNFHVGKETHVFHLHAHQWMAGNDLNRGAYLDSQTIGPQQGLSYRIYHGGLDRYAPKNASAETQGWWETLGSGNRNRTVGDSIFHCHLYPHFAQGMWAFWRVHDVLEDGSRKLPDGQSVPGLSVTKNLTPERGRPGSVMRVKEDQSFGKFDAAAAGTPIPGLIPLPDYALPLLPSYGVNGMPGYPFYIAGEAGHRSPQPPLDMAKDATGKEQNGGLPRHVVLGGKAIPNVQRKVPNQIPEDKLVATSLALGDVTMHLEELELKKLNQGGEPLERNAMAFHHDGRRRDMKPDRTTDLVALDLFTVLGERVAHVDPAKFIAYSSPILRRDGTIAPTGGLFAVNGSPAAPGAPYADPCGIPAGLHGQEFRRFNGRDKMNIGAKFVQQNDPLHLSEQVVPDPGTTGFRRYDASVVQMDMVVNRAGWHDPQARINVLSEDANKWKGEKRSDAEPFYFRAFSGECIEFRHTNETPKDLELDDFQLKVPTDTIGQHIHLVKFDVTSADGSGNGYNYEDGTFAPDEILARICAANTYAKKKGMPPFNPERVTKCAEWHAADEAYNKAVRNGSEKQIQQAKKKLHEIALWRIKRGSPADKGYFQTTIQRWFADPILSNDGQGGIADRTLRTVFTHDHFAPSNIQQHGFYNALLVEPMTHVVCLTRAPHQVKELNEKCAEARVSTAGSTAAQTAIPQLTLAPNRDPRIANQRPTYDEIVAEARRLVGPRASVFDPLKSDPIHPDAREYALAIADFALLYDGEKKSKLGNLKSGDVEGLDRLHLEAKGLTTPHADDAKDGTKVPAVAAKLKTLAPSAHVELAVVGGEIRQLHGNPIAPPPRPESISQKHHDPYLVNYRTEPIPLRVGAHGKGNSTEEPDFLRNPCILADESKRLTSDHNRIDRQRRDARGDMANVFRSTLHGDPCTPILESLAKEPGQSSEVLNIRLIQGAQEVQHTLVIEGTTFQRNKDQIFPAARMGTDRTARITRADDCHSSSQDRLTFGETGRPRQFLDWQEGRIQKDEPFWNDFGKLIAGCDSGLTRVPAQEVGISEHFELGERFRSASGASGNRIIELWRDREERRIAVSREASISSDTRPASDTLYHFGSQDALWNGAFGNVRTYDSYGATDVSACLRGGIKSLPGSAKKPSGEFDPEKIHEWCKLRIGERLLPFHDLRARVAPLLSPGAASARLSTSRDVQAVEVGQRRILKSPTVGDSVKPERVCRVFNFDTVVKAGSQEHDHTRLVVVAIEAKTLLGDLNYGGTGTGRLYDPNALVLVSLREVDWFFGPIAKDVTQWGSEIELIDEKLGAIDASGVAVDKTKLLAERATLLDKARTKLSELPRPRAEIIAKLKTEAQKPLEIRLPAGECTVLFTVNLLDQVNPAGVTWKTVADVSGDARMPNIVPLNVLLRRGEGRKNVMPSAMVGVSLPIPAVRGAGIGEQTHLPFGINPGHLAAPGKMTFTRYISQYLTRDIGDLDYRPDLKADDLTKYRYAGVPYSFGALPIHVVGDMINHPAHGLYGTLVIEPTERVTPGRGGIDSIAAAKIKDEQLAVNKRLGDSRILSTKQLIPQARIMTRDPADAVTDRAVDTGLVVNHPAIKFESAAPSYLGAIKYAEIPRADVREHVLVYQDGLNLWSSRWHGKRHSRSDEQDTTPDLRPLAGMSLTSTRRTAALGLPIPPSGPHPLANCSVCDDSYDLGEKGVSYTSTPFTRRLAGFGGASIALGLQHWSDDESNLNAYAFPPNFLHPEFPAPKPLQIDARPNEQVMVRLSHPSGRARQRSFVLYGASYYDMAPGFGSAHSALVAPGKAINASFCAPRPAGPHLWRDGPQHIFAAGVWGHLNVSGQAAVGPAACTTTVPRQ